MIDSPRRRKPFHRRWWVWGCGVVVLLCAAAIASMEATSRSSFCNRCHIMKSYYAAWETDVHSGTACVNCHIAPGMDNFVSAKLNGLGQVVDDWLNRTSTKPSASVSDFACTRSGCHAVGNLATPPSEDRPYFFDHQKHLNLEHRGIDIHCTTCHSHIKGDKHFEVNTNTCVTCHLLPHAATAEAFADAGGQETLATHGMNPGPAAPSGCSSCHAPPDHPIKQNGLTIDHAEFLRFGASCESCHRGATAIPTPVSDTQCLQCHDFGMERVTDADDMHRVHTVGLHKVECFSCHGVTRHGPSAEAMSLERFDCRSCHEGQHNIQRTNYLFAAANDAHPPRAGDAVSPMFLVHVDCTGCHIVPSRVTDKPTGATVRRASPEACDACHRPGLGAQMIPLWQRTTRRLYDEAAALLPTPDDPWDASDPTAAADVERARRLLDLVRVDGSWGVHNPLYTEQLIGRARQALDDARASTTATGGATP